MTNTPLWIPIAQLVLTGFLGLGAATVAFMQWRTAHQKIVLDLFEKRVAVISKINEFYRAVLRDQPVDGVEMFDPYFQSSLLFGPEPAKLIRKSIDLCVSHKDAAHRAEFVEQFAKIRDQMQPHFKSYMKMDHRLVRTPSEWFHDKNKARKSFGEPPAEASL